MLYVMILVGLNMGQPVTHVVPELTLDECVSLVVLNKHYQKNLDVQYIGCEVMNGAGSEEVSVHGAKAL